MFRQTVSHSTQERSHNSAVGLVWNLLPPDHTRPHFQESGSSPLDNACCQGKALLELVDFLGGSFPKHGLITCFECSSLGAKEGASPYESDLAWSCLVRIPTVQI